MPSIVALAFSIHFIYLEMYIFHELIIDFSFIKVACLMKALIWELLESFKKRGACGLNNGFVWSFSNKLYIYISCSSNVCKVLFLSLSEKKKNTHSLSITWARKSKGQNDWTSTSFLKVHMYLHCKYWIGRQLLGSS